MEDSKKPILSLCIPTYNRARFLDENMGRIVKQIKEFNLEDKVEFIVSDNCSPDNTHDVVQKHIDSGAKIRYIRNEKNLGADGNFINCFKKAEGRYIWLLGDDDYIVDGILKVIIDTLGDNEIGLLHLSMNTPDNSVKFYNDAKSFLCDISFWITFMSISIINSRFVKGFDFDKYRGTHLIQVPVFMTAARESKQNVLVSYAAIEGGQDIASNGGYNYFQVFVKTYLQIWKEQMQGYPDFKKIYKNERINLFKKHVRIYIVKLLIFKNKSNLKADGGWKILIKYYSLSPKAYWLLCRTCAGEILSKFKK